MHGRLAITLYLEPNSGSVSELGTTLKVRDSGIPPFS